MTDRNEIAALVKKAVIAHDFYAEPAADRILEWLTARDVRRDAEVAAKAAANERAEWADYFEHVGSHVGDPRFSQEFAVTRLRGPRPFGAASSLGAENPETNGTEVTP